MTAVERARVFISDRIFEPVLTHPDASEKIKNVIMASKRWVDNLDYVGDIYNYMQHVIESSDASALALIELELDSYELIIDSFKEKFSPYIDQRSTLDDFIVGADFSGWKINGIAKKYDMRSGGILTVGHEPNHAAVLVKVNLSGGDYDNQWLEDHKSLKYYLKATKRQGNSVFSEERSENRAILNYPEVPVYAFTRKNPKGLYEFSGVFSCARVHTESDGKKWFELVRKEEIGAPILFDQLVTEQEREVAEAITRTPAERKRRLSTAPRKPKKLTTITIQYSRNPDVSAEVLERANGYCENCRGRAPFLRVSNGTPYLEVHHKVRLADGGDDTVDNAIALCPNCHRKSHFG